MKSTTPAPTQPPKLTGYVTDEQVDEITKLCAHSFRSFGGGRGSTSNPIAAALQNEPAQFAAGVDISDVVRFVLESAAVQWQFTSKALQGKPARR
jgi:hypothetical protein